ncbi:MAG TPA: hypothetical protein DGT23_04775 [Micromonosporaceae bacterium]|nr:hypothetical protein [Micromonosporaceae bacterium]
MTQPAFGEELRRLRVQRGLSLRRLARQVHYDQGYVSKIENGLKPPTGAFATACDTVLDTGNMLTALVPETSRRGRTDPERTAAAAKEDEVKRLEFIAAVVAAGVGAALPGSPPPRRIGANDVASYRDALTRLYQLDDQHGGGAVYELTLRTVRRLRDTLARSSYDAETGRQLQSITGQATEHAGWLAYDAGRHAEARYCWLEAMHTARMADDAQTEMVVLSSMSLQAATSGRPGEAVDLAAADQRAARARTTPRMRAVLLAREARGHAGQGDAGHTWRAFNQADRELESGFSEADPSLLQFFGHVDLALERMRAAADLTDLVTAEQAGREALATIDQAAYPRNYTWCLAEFASLLLARGEREEALMVAAQAVARMPEFGSKRITDQVGFVLRQLAAQRNDPRVGDFLDWSTGILSGADARP